MTNVGGHGLSAWLQVTGVMHLACLKLKSALNLPVLFPMSSHCSSLLFFTLGEAHVASSSHIPPGQERVFPLPSQNKPQKWG